MKIAVASEGVMVSEHFGHCSSFNIFDCEDHKILRKEIVSNSNEECGTLPNFLKGLGVDAVIAGGIGAGALNNMMSNGFHIATGAKGTAEDAVNAYLQGTLTSVGSTCNHHEHAHGKGHSCCGH